MTQPVGIIKKTMRWTPEGAVPGPWTWLQPGPNPAPPAAPTLGQALDEIGRACMTALDGFITAVRPIGQAAMTALDGFTPVPPVDTQADYARLEAP